MYFIIIMTSSQDKMFVDMLTGDHIYYSGIYCNNNFEKYIKYNIFFFTKLDFSQVIIL